MDFVSIDLHKTSSQICTLSEGGELTERRIKTTRASFVRCSPGRRRPASGLKPRPRASGLPASLSDLVARDCQLS